jgi:hypothetical protein
MADVEDCSPVADPSGSGGCCKKAALRIMRTILHGLMVSILFSVSLFADLYLYRKHNPHPYDDGHQDMYGVASLVAEFVAYAAVGCLYIYNSSGRQENFISAGYLVLVLSAFLLSSIEMLSESYSMGKFVLGANMVAISTYCVWKLSFILPMLTNTVAVPLSLTILHAAIVTILLALVIVSYVLLTAYDFACLVQLVDYNAIGCLYICSSSRQKEKDIPLDFLYFFGLSSSCPRFPTAIFAPASFSRPISWLYPRIASGNCMFSILRSGDGLTVLMLTWCHCHAHRNGKKKHCFGSTITPRFTSKRCSGNSRATKSRP